MSEKEHKVETTLNPDIYRRFLELKEELGLKWNAKVLRVIIGSAHRRVVLKKENL